MLSIFSICFLSCIENKRRDSIAKIVEEWTGKEIQFPEGLTCIPIGKDTTCIDLHNDNYKILLYVDSLGCTSCRLNLTGWKKIMNESDSAFIRKPEFVFIFQPKMKDEKEVQNIFKSNGFSHSVFIDKENETDKINKFPTNTEFQCFLLDKDNKVIMVGNPSQYTVIWALYKKVINERETKALMKKGNWFYSFSETANQLPDLNLIRKEAIKKTSLI